MYRKESNSWIKHLDFILLDILCIQLSLIFSYGFRNGFENLLRNEQFQKMAISILIVDLLIVLMQESYKGILRRGYYHEFKYTLKHVSYTMLIFVLFNFLLKVANSYSRMVVILSWELSVLLCYFVRVIRKKALKQRAENKEKGRDSLIIITDSTHAEKFVGRILDNNFEDKRLTGVILVDKDMTGQQIKGIQVVASAYSAVEYICQKWVDEVIVDYAIDKKVPEVKELLDDCMEMGITIHMAVRECGFPNNDKSIVENVGGYTVISNSFTMVTDRQLFFKRLLDICGGLVGCFFTVLLFIFVAPVIYIKSPGPIFFSQMRVGRNGKRFKIYKFRSMYTDAEERKKELMEKNKIKDGMMFKMDDDPRIIKGIGHFIRKTSIDEFPQFFNVLKGDMSLVGTRPPTIDEWEKYKKHHRKRLVIKPGLTGMWQTSGRSNITDFEEVVALDTKYIMEWSMELDVKILFKTVMVMFTGKGSQ